MKGYEFQKEQYVRFTDEELKSLEGEASKVIDIAEFVPLPKVDPIYFEKTYYLGPDKGGEKAYRLLADAMAKSDRVALATFVMRGKESLVLIRPAQDGLMLHTMYFADEVRDFGEIEKGKSVKLARRRARAGRAADRRAVARRVQARAVPGRLPQPRARDGELQGRGQGDHRRGARGPARAGDRPDGRAQAEPRQARRRRRAAAGAGAPVAKKPPAKAPKRAAASDKDRKAQAGRK